MHLDSFQRIVVDPASISIVRYTSARPYVITVNSTDADLGAMFASAAEEPAPAERAPEPDAQVGGGLGDLRRRGGPERRNEPPVRRSRRAPTTPRG